VIAEPKQSKEVVTLKKVKAAIFFFSFITIMGCSNNEKGFEASSSFPEFPVPSEAELVESKENGYEKYLYNAIGNDGGIREGYKEVIEKKGWELQEKLQLGNYYVFKREGQLVGITIHGSSDKDFFTISEHDNN